MGVGIDDVEQLCLECDRLCSSRRSLGNHVARSHPELLGLEGYVVKHLIKSLPKCGCGCDQVTKWHKTHYRFNDYVNGHNDAGFRNSQPEFTKEQIERRNDSIRRSYNERKEEITKKISEAVAIGLANSKFDFSTKRKDMWNDQVFREKQHVSRVKSWSGEKGEARKAKVFTPEFGKKISKANMRRDAKKTSKAEQRAYEQIRTNFPDAEASKWFNFTERTMCVDVWLPTQQALIEIDGVYWHGLDRTRDFTVDQLITMANDLDKDSLVASRSMTLIRFKEDSDLSGCKTLDELICRSYKAIVSGKTLKDDRRRLSDDDVIIARETLLTADATWVEDQLLPALEFFLRAYVSTYGWFYMPQTGVLREALDDLRSSSAGRHASLWLKSFVRSFWDVDDGPRRAFDDDRALRSVLRYRLGLNNSMPYEYALSSGDKVTAHETFDVSFKEIRRGFIVQRKAVSWFNPSLACDVYRTFLGDVERPVVWDPSIGFSARLLGFAAQYPRGTYVGTDPSMMMCDDAVRLAEELVKVLPEISVNLLTMGSENYRPKPESLDMVFTSPPYFNKERYVDEPGQCWRDHPDIDSWTKNYLVPTLAAAHVGLRPSRFCVINIDEDLRSVIIAAGRSVGFEHVEDVTLPVKVDHFARAKGRKPKAESLVVFRRT